MARVLAYLTLLFIIIGSCAAPSWRDKFEEEFEWDKPYAVTEEFNVKVAYPKWLAKEDIPTVLRVVDHYIAALNHYYPWAAENFDYTRYTVWIHESLGGFVAGGRDWNVWARGWQIGKFLVVAWDYSYDFEGHPDGVGTRDILPALPHEYFHAIFQEQYGNADPGHFLYFPNTDVQRAMAMSRMASPEVELSESTIEGAKRYIYFPWVVPGTWE